MPDPSTQAKGTVRFAAAMVMGLAMFLSACAAPGTAHRPSIVEPPVPIPKRLRPEPEPRVLATRSDFYVIRIRPGDTPASLAREFLGSPDQAWIITDFNDTERFRSGREVIIPRTPLNPVGVYVDGVQTLPILCYHRFGDKKAKMVVSPKAFSEQMAFLSENGYRVVPLSAVPGFLAGTEPLPKRAVVLTMDDGYKSVYRHAFPVLKRYGFPATVFLYTDFLGARSALNTEEIRELLASGLVDIQPHSKAHSNMGLPNADETREQYLQRIDDEISRSTGKIKKRFDLGAYVFAYPYGATSDAVIEHLEDSGFRLGVTVQRGGNPAYAAPFLVHRTMVYGGESLSAFEKKLETFRKMRLR